MSEFGMTRRLSRRLLCLARSRSLRRWNYQWRMRQKLANQLPEDLCQTGFRFTKIHGLLRSGTNYLSKLLIANFRIILLNPWEMGWKHGHCQYERYSDFIFVIKNPYSWLISLRNWEAANGRMGKVSIGEFLRTPLTHGKFRNAWNVSGVIDAWNNSTASWMVYEGRSNTAFLRYEDLIASYCNQMELIYEKLKFRKKQQTFVNIRSRADDWKTRNLRTKFDVNYYLEERYMTEFNKNDLRLVRDKIDQRLAERWHYRVF